MKKGLVGCLVAALVIVLLCGGIAYWYVLRPMWSAGSAVLQNAQDFAKVAELDKSVRNQSPFAPPADGKLNQAQVQAFVAVQNLMTTRLGADFDGLKQKYDAVEAERKQAGKEADAAQVMGAYADLSGLMLKARQAQVEGINQQGLSLEEYRWIRVQAYAAMPYVEMTPEQVQQMTELAQPSTVAAPASADSPPLPPPMQKALDENAEAMAKAQAEFKAANDSPEMQAARANADLLRPYKDVIEKTLNETWLGM